MAKRKHSYRRAVLECLKEETSATAGSIAKSVDCSTSTASNILKAVWELYPDEFTVTSSGRHLIYTVKGYFDTDEALRKMVNYYERSRTDKRLPSKSKREKKKRRRLSSGEKRLLENMPAEIAVESASFVVRLGTYKIHCVITDGILDATMSM